MMLAVAVLSMMTVALGALTQAVRVAADFTEGTSAATQHARVALHRIDAAVTASFANEAFPGAVAFADTIGLYNYPDTLVVWRPAGDPAAPAGLPQFNEIVVFCPNPSAPNELLEITSPADTRQVPPITDLATWSSELATLKTGPTSQKILLTDLVHSASPSGEPAVLRGAVRFAVELSPSAQAWADYQASSITFDEVPWAQTIYGSQSGLRQTRVACELQLMSSLGGTSSASAAIPFFGSAASYWELRP
jgi:hypothetical protein